MIRPLIKEQLEKCQFADLNNYDARTNTFQIRKYSKELNAEERYTEEDKNTLLSFLKEL